MIEIVLPPPAMLADVLYFAVLPPLAVGAAVLAVLLWLGGLQRASAASALAFATATLVGLWVRTASSSNWTVDLDDPHFEKQSRFLATLTTLAIWLRDALTVMPGDSTWNRLGWGGLAVWCAGRVARHLDLLDAWLIRTASVILAAWLIVPQRDESAWLMPALALLVLAEWAVLEAIASESAGGTIVLALALCFGAASLVLIHAGTARLTELATVLSSALLGVAIIASLRRVDAGGVAGMAAFLLPGTLLMGQQETDSAVPWSAFALVAAAPLMLAFTWPLRSWPGVWLRIVQLTLVLLPLGIAAFLAARTGPLHFE